MASTARRRATVALTLACALALVASACAGGDDTGGAGSEAAAPTAPANPPPVVRGEVVAGPDGVVRRLSARLARRLAIGAVVDLVAEEPVAVQITARGPRDPNGRNGADRHVVEVPRTARARTEHRIPVVGLRAETTYTLDVAALDRAGERVGGGRIRITTGPLPPYLPDLEVTVSRPGRMAPGVTLFDLQRWGVEVPEGQPNGSLVALDAEGHVVWYHANPLGTGDARMNPDGTILNLFPPFGFEQLDLLRTIERTWVWGDAEDQVPDGPIVVDSPRFEHNSFHHEVGFLPDGNILLFGRYQRDLTPAQRQAYCPGHREPFGIREDVVMEITPDGEVVQEWPLFEVVDPAEVPGRVMCAVDDDTYRDWAHGNGVVLDARRNALIVTARHIDLLFAFRYRDDADGPSGELLWSIGPDGTLPLDGEPSYGVHAPQVLPDGSILLFDNGNDRPVDVPYSRAVRYEIDDSSPDPADWTARQVWAFRTTDLVTGGPLYADFLGDADLLGNGNVLVSAGGINQVEPPARGRMFEVVPAGDDGGTIVFDVSIPDTWTSYRAERLPSLYAGPDWVGS